MAFQSHIVNMQEDPVKILKSVKWFNKDKLLLFGLGNDGVN